MKRIYLTLSLLVFIGFQSFGQTTLQEDANGVLNTGKVVTQTSNGQTFFTGHQLGTGYSYPASGIFRAWTDNPNGVANYFYDGLLNGTITYSVRADGQGYFAGNVGIGTTTPQQKFAVSNNGAEGLEVYLAQPTGVVGLQSFNRASSSYSKMQFDASQFAFMEGNVLIGQTSQINSAYRLDVLGSVRANAITVNSTGADFVFEPTYSLLSLSDLKRYIDQNHHLPDIESAKQMQTDGLNLGDNQTKLLQKIEELTLYLIDKDKTESEQQKQINLQKQQLDIAETLLKEQAEQLNKIQKQLDALTQK